VARPRSGKRSGPTTLNHPQQLATVEHPCVNLPEPAASDRRDSMKAATLTPRRHLPTTPVTLARVT
jgi:hypothetical protein